LELKLFALEGCTIALDGCTIFTACTTVMSDSVLIIFGIVVIVCGIVSTIVIVILMRLQREAIERQLHNERPARTRPTLDLKLVDIELAQAAAAA
jgi:hypothetical protein